MHGYIKIVADFHASVHSEIAFVWTESFELKYYKPFEPVDLGKVGEILDDYELMLPRHSKYA